MMLEAFFTDLKARRSTVQTDARQAVLDEMYAREVADKSAKLLRALDKLANEKRALEKINRPDQVTYTADGNTATSTYSKSRLDEVTKQRKVVDKLTQSIEKAFNGDFSSISN